MWQSRFYCSGFSKVSIANCGSALIMLGNLILPSVSRCGSPFPRIIEWMYLKSCSLSQSIGFIHIAVILDCKVTKNPPICE